jgi:hypothetical protein
MDRNRNLICACYMCLPENAAQICWFIIIFLIKMAHFQTHPYNKRTVLKWGIRHHGAAPVQWLTLKITLGVPL